ncbi:MAG: 4-(cytidine 5'-diphospho)-2-C-methyl-D-erythritol kinase [Verrucomicrobia bacterium]|jgi:4-diphosphocytidyl-2-C-methyl-D-erythritol kinase|nr:4-(cytidine 5'-diphospho)-2-C-methyl-D-erythritol kinase [Verrucomicrobiota bacterium]
MTLEKSSPCKVNLILNILGKRPDGFHELETVMHPVNVCDHLSLARSGNSIQLTCSIPELPVDSRNLVFRAATAFLEVARVTEGVRMHLDKRIPLAAGLGGGSGNAATTLVGLNELFGHPLKAGQLHSIAARLGSDVPFFLQSNPALATGRGEHVESLEPFPALRGASILLVHPGFGIATAWAYQELARFPKALNGDPGRARKLVAALQTGDLCAAGREFYNSLEAPALEKYPVLALYQEFLREQGAAVALMSGSGSTTFAIFPDKSKADAAVEPFQSKFGTQCWITVVPL